MKLTSSAASTVGEDSCVFFILPRRKPDLPYDAFFEHWREVHGPLHAGLDIVQANVPRYEHIYKDVAKSEELAKAVGIPPLPYDGLVIHQASSYDKFAIWNDKDASAKLAADRVNFASPEKAMVLGQSKKFIDKTEPRVKGLREDRVRLVACFRRKPDISVEAFQKHWGEVHSRIYTNLDVVQKNILLYEQIHVDHAATAELATKTRCIDPGYDGIMIQEAESYEKIFEVLANPEFLSVATEDEKHFLDRASVAVLPGTYNIFI